VRTEDFGIAGALVWGMSVVGLTVSGDCRGGWAGVWWGIFASLGMDYTFLTMLSYVVLIL